MQSLNKIVHLLFLIAIGGGVGYYALSERPADKTPKRTGRTYAQQAEADMQVRLDDLRRQQEAALNRSIEIGRRATGR